MAEIVQKPNAASIGFPQPGDEYLIGPMHVQAWLESYLDLHNGITEEVLKSIIGFVDSEESAAYRANIFAEASVSPEKVIYRVVRIGNDVVGFMHCTKGNGYNNLDGIYLLNRVKGQGIGRMLVEEFINWSDKNIPCRLEVFSTNKTGIAFYEKFGFKKTDKAPEQYKNTNITFIEMVREVAIV